MGSTQSFVNNPLTRWHDYCSESADSLRVTDHEAYFCGYGYVLGVGVQAVPASADMTYTLNCDPVACSPAGNYGSVTLHQLGTGVAGSATNIVEVTVNLITVMNDFAGTGAGFAINWNITGNSQLDDAASMPMTPPTIRCWRVPLTIPPNFAIKRRHGDQQHLQGVAPLATIGMYAIEYSAANRWPGQLTTTI